MPLNITRKSDEHSPKYLKDGGETITNINGVPDVKKLCNSDGSNESTRLRVEQLSGSAHDEGTVEKMNSNPADQLLCSSLSASASLCVDLGSPYAEEGMPVGVPSEKAIVNGSVFDDFVHLDLPCIPKEDSLVQLVGVNDMSTPQQCLSVKQMAPVAFHSLPNGLLEHMDSQKALFFYPYDGKDYEAGIQDDVSCNHGTVGDAFLVGRSFSGSLPSSSFPFGRGVRKPPFTPPPNGKIFHKVISKSIGHSSEKRFSQNPELTCFRIDEDTSLEEGLGSIKQDPENISNKKRALVDVTSKYENSPSAFSVAERITDRHSVNSVNTEINSSLVGMNSELQNAYETHKRYKFDDKENFNFSIGGSGLRKSNKFPQNRLTGSQLLEKGSEKGSGTFLEKGLKRNNIVSNISSFIPFVQQKKAAAVLKGKRDIKVKALETAEAAKRLEVKKDIERRMRKEATKIKRANQENLKQLEVKKKEEERKKKEFEMAAMKRHKEEERKRERKRKCIGETKKPQREFDDKLRAQKELRRKPADEEQKRKELVDDSKRQQKKDDQKEDAGCSNRTGVESCPSKSFAGETNDKNSFRVGNGMSEVKDDHEKVASNSGNSCNTNADDNVTEGNQELQSYEMSPYQISDDEEDDEDNDMVERKFVPSWARSESLFQSLLSIQLLDPAKIFLHERCSSLSEVLIPRNQKPS